MTVIVFVGLALITDWWMAMPFMALVGVTWGLLFIAGNFHLMENNPRSRTAAEDQCSHQIGARATRQEDCY